MLKIERTQKKSTLKKDIENDGERARGQWNA